MRSQECNIIDKNPTNAANAEKRVASQAKFGILAEIKRSTNKEGGEGVFETEVPDGVLSAAHVDNHQGIHRDGHATQSDIESDGIGARIVLAGAMVTFAFVTM